MAFRAKVRKALKGNSSSSSPRSNPNNPPKRTDIEYYKPGEIPRSKYRGPWNQKHQDKLKAFSFEDAPRGRKTSIPASYSPRGTRAESRRTSWVSWARSSLSGRSHAEDEVDSGRGRSRASQIEQVVGGPHDDADARNVSLSRPTTTEGRPVVQATNKLLALEKTPPTKGDMKQETSSQFFAIEDLPKAMNAANINSDQ